MKEWPRIRPRKGRGDYEIDCGLVDGKRRVFVRSTWQDADELAKSLRRDRQRLGVLAGKLSPRQTIEAAKAFDLLNGRSIVDAVDYYLKHNPVLQEQRTIMEAIEEYSQSQVRKNCREITVASTRRKLMAFASDFGQNGGSVSVFDREILQGWLDNLQSHASALGYCRVLNAFFAFCVRKGWRPDNPMATVDRPIIERSANRILGCDEAASLMVRAQGINDPDFVTRMAILLFAGLRPFEAANVKPADINGQIHVRAEGSKLRQERYVPISENLRAWLEKYDGNPYTCRGWDGKRRKIMPVGWTPDITRKSFASYHLAMFDNPVQTACIMGHTGGVNTLYRYYRVPVEKAEAAKFWQILPQG